MVADCPRFFYKYRKIDEYLIKQIEEDEIRLAPPVDFNDPFDCKPSFSMKVVKNGKASKKLQDNCRKFAPMMNRQGRRFNAKIFLREVNNPDLIDEVRTKYYAMIRENVGVYCMSTTWESILMWSHYANNHQGVCLEYDANDVFFTNAFQVAYSEERPWVYGMKDGADETQLNSALLTKSSQWAYEKEWRIIKYENGPGLYKIPHGLLRKVIFGVCARTEQIQEVLRAIEKRNKKPEILYAKQVEGSFKLKLKNK